jgi:Holliday junction resolvase
MEDLQKKLDQYIKKNHSKKEIGKMYERQIRYIYERNGWRVTPYGILKEKADLGRDLICVKGKKVIIIQAKNWSKNSIIHEKHLMQLAGTMLYYIFTKKKFTKGLFITTTKLSETAKDVARKLNIQWKHIKLDKKYPMIKCNINKRGKKLFFLPFNKYYDNVYIDASKREFYTNKIKHCLMMGFKYGGKN